MSYEKSIQFKTLVFMDLESTSVTPEDLAKNVQITEMSFVAIHVDRFNEKLRPPRVLNKLTMCIQPKSIVSLTAMEMTGLYNGNLECQETFSDKTVILLKAFLCHLESPICLLAHNGSNFDFRLLKSELYALRETLPENVYCMDTLTAAKNLIGKTYDSRYIDECPDTDVLLHEENGSQPIGTQTQEDIFDMIGNGLAVHHGPLKTPVKPNRNNPYPMTLKTPEKAKKKLFLSPKKRKIFDFGEQVFYPGGMKGYALKDLYKTVIGEDIESAHHAEADVLNLLKVCHKIEGFLEYIEYNAKSFNSNFFVKPLWG